MKLPPLRLLDYLGIVLLAIILLFLPVISSDLNVAPSRVITRPALFLPRQTKAVLAPAVSAIAVYIFDPESETILYEKNSQTRLYPASTTKLMTALAALDFYDADQVLSVRSGRVLGSSAHLKVGDQLTVESLLDALLINSGNDAALVLADNSPTGYSGFIDRMNQKARDLGLTDTHFTNASGLVNPDHFTTARDLTLIAKKAVENALIRKIVAQKSLTITDTSGKVIYPLEATNLLLGFEGVRGLKTGWTPESGECLVSLVTRNGHSVIVTVLNSTDRFGDSKKLIDWVYNNFSWETI